jgi:hypothetical protein
MTSNTKKTELPILRKIVERRIFHVRGQRVMLSSDLSELYQVEPRTLIQAIKRNPKRFPLDFMFQLSLSEARELLRSQFVILKRGQHMKFAPYAFTEQGVAMLSSVLRSEVAIEVNVEIMRAFLKFRELASTNAHLLRKIDELEKKVGGHDSQLQQVFQAIRDLMHPVIPSKRRIGIKS